MIWLAWLDTWSFAAGAAWMLSAVTLPLGLSAWRLRKRLHAQIGLSIQLSTQLALREPLVLVQVPDDAA